MSWEKYAFLPIKYPNLIKHYYDQSRAFWVPTEIDYSQDRSDWPALSEHTRKFLRMWLCFFAQFDGLVIENITENFQGEIGNLYKEATSFYNIQNAIETIHNETYSLLISTLITDEKERGESLNAIEHIPSLRAIADWVKKWMSPDKSILERIIAFAHIEGAIFNGAFCAIYWIKRHKNVDGRAVLPGLCTANKYIARDERIHTMFAVELFKTMCADKRVTCPKPSQEAVHSIAAECMAASSDFLTESLQVSLIGMDDAKMKAYIQNNIDQLCQMLGYTKLYNVENPFDWMANIGLQNTESFFETRPTSYTKVQKAEDDYDKNIDF